MRNLIYLTSAKYISDFKIELKFSNNEIGIIDLETHLDLPIFKELRNIEYFKNFKVNAWTIEWANGADFSPEFLHSILQKSQAIL